MNTKLIVTTLLLAVSIAATAQTDPAAAKANVNSSAEAWLKKNASGYTIYRDTIAKLDSTESCEVVFDFEKNINYKLAVVLSGESNASLQLEDGTVGAEVYSSGTKDANGNTVAEANMSITENAAEGLKVITIGGGIGMPVRYLILKKK
jgi:hypothetical protein